MHHRLSPQEQHALVQAARDVVSTAPLYRAQMPGSGRPFTYRQSGAGWGWTSGHGGGYRYQRTHPVTGSALPPIPQCLLDLAQQFGLQADSLLINWYTENSSLGLHQDRDEQDLSHAIVSISLGDTAEFLLGGTTRSAPVETVKLESGSVLVLAGADRMRFHGVKRVIPGTAPPGLLARSGRINLTLRRSQ